MIFKIFSMRDTALALLIFLVLAAPYSEASDDQLELLAGSTDANIRRVLEPLLPISKAQLETFDADVGLVYTHRAFDTEGSSHSEIRDKVWWIRRGEAADLTNYVMDFEPGVEVKEVRAFLIRPGEYEISGALEAEIQRLGEDRIHLTQGGKDNRLANLVIGFDTARPGDILGVSIRLREKRPMRWEHWLVGENEPIARAELHLKNDWEMAYAVFGSRFLQGQMKKEILEEKNGQITDVRIWADSLNPVRQEPYSPPRHMQSPQFIVAWRATRIRMDNGLIWFYNEYWNQIAVKMSDIEKQFMKKSKKTAQQAGKSSQGLKSREAADALYRFVRDDMLDINSRFYIDRDKMPTVDQVIEGRSGSAWEKAYVLLAMLRSQNFDADLVYAHDPEDGYYFENYPSWGQMSEPLVRVREAKVEYWYDLECEGCLPGTIRERLKDTEALEYRQDAKELDDRLWNTAVEEAHGRNIDLYRYYMDKLKKKPWSRIVRTPGKSGKWAGWCEEQFVYGSESGDPDQAHLILKSIGRTPLQTRVDDQGDSAEAARNWAMSRYDAVLDASIGNFSPPGADTLSLELELECSPLVLPMGDTWILPPETVFGEPVVPAWPENRLTEFHVPRNTHRRWIFKVPLPVGWDEAVLPANCIVNAGQIMYQVKFEIEDGDFLVTRTLIEQGGTVSNPGKTAEIGAKLSTVNELETSPVILTRKSAGP